MHDGFDILMNDRAFIQVSGHVVRSRTDHLYTARMRLMIGFSAFKTRQEAMMDID